MFLVVRTFDCVMTYSQYYSDPSVAYVLSMLPSGIQRESGEIRQESLSICTTGMREEQRSRKSYTNSKDF